MSFFGLEIGNNSEVGLKLIEYYMIMIEFNEERKNKKGVNYWKKRICDLTEDVAKHSKTQNVIIFSIFYLFNSKVVLLFCEIISKNDR